MSTTECKQNCRCQEAAELHSMLQLAEEEILQLIATVEALRGANMRLETRLQEALEESRQLRKVIHGRSDKKTT